MRRHRFGRVAAALAAVYLAAVVVLGVVAQVTGDISPIWVVVVDRHGFTIDDFPPWWWLVVVLVLIAAVQAWAYWQVLRGREQGEAARHGREVRLLRAVLYVSVGNSLLLLLPIPYTWWRGLVSVLIQLVTTWLFFRVLRGTAPRWLRLLILVTGTLCAVSDLATTVAWGLGGDLFAGITGLLWVQNLSWSMWMVSLLVAQARDPRWSAATVRFGLAAVIMSLLQPTSFMTVSLGDEVAWEELFYDLLRALSVFGLVWHARSAHDLGSLPPPAPRPRSTRAPARRWPLPMVAIVLPLLPAAANLANAMPFWLGPQNVLSNAVRENGSFELSIAWYALDLLVGVGIPSLLILAAVWWRTHRLLRATTLTLFLLAAIAVSTFAEVSPDLHGELPLYPDSLFVKDGALVSTGISPLWYGLALTASALILLIGYAAPPTQRVRRNVLVACLASVVMLCLLPAADQARGPVTTAQECDPPEPWELQLREGRRARELTAEQMFVCALRQENTGLRQFAATTPDQIVLGYGRWMCDLHTRNDSQQLARWKVDRDDLTYPLAGICPSAAAIVQAAQAEEDKEMAQLEAESQRRCDATPHHRPRIEPAKATRIKEPLWTDYGVLQTYESEEDPNLDPGNRLVSSEPGILTVLTHSDFDICVTVETYTRRPPVETKGWDTVVEVGYHSPTGEIVLTDLLSGTELPDLSLNRRAGHYRIRVHYAWFPWKGEDHAAQRLLIMAYPAPGDKEIVYRK
ncbi:hypothetical protein [Streptosporangium sp. KLBMP 9127]|nr:hypothetical protein [Streptosporangium sp. KLBMP 9127]